VQVLIRQPTLADMKEFVVAARSSQSLHRPWVAAPDTPAKFNAYLNRTQPPDNYAFLVYRKKGSTIVGVINVTNVVRGLFQSAYLGYYAFAGSEGQGFMRQGLQAVIGRCFKVLGLHRLEANIQPGNAASVALVSSCGFTREGYSPRYLKIGGRWRDHERWAIRAS
jgi:ribosomal-protein-alanine N-acetyltransferase